MTATNSSSREELENKISDELTKRYISNDSESAAVHDKQYNQAIRDAIQSEKPLVEKFNQANEQMASIDQTLEEKCAETFSKLPKYTELLVKIRANLVVLANNAKRLKDLSSEVAKECDVDTTTSTLKSDSK